MQSEFNFHNNGQISQKRPALLCGNLKHKLLHARKSGGCVSLKSL